MKMRNLLLLLLIFLPNFSYSQSSYLIGTSQANIEPDQSLVSLHLGGYGAPKEGRFTLQWINKGPVSEITAMGGLTDKLYIVSNSDLLWMNPSINNSAWKKAGKAENIKCVAGLNGRLYAVRNNGDLLVTKVQGVIKWKKIGSVEKSVTALAASDNKLFAADLNGSLWSADLSKKSIEWLELESIKGIISLTADHKKLYALTSDGEIGRAHV